jgi:ribosomal protein S18 acetylase RimI-like enzyme
MELISRAATEEDIATIQEIANSNILSLNPNEKSIGEIEAGEFLRGFFDPAITRLTKLREEEEWQSFITLNPDVSRKRFYLDIYTRPGADSLDKTLQLAIDLAQESNSQFQLWLGVQSNDFPYKNLLENRGFTILRKYWTLEMNLSAPSESVEVLTSTIREVDFDNPEELRAFHAVHQDSFSKHFGFMPRQYQEWSEFLLRDRESQNIRAWLISLDGQDVGFVECSDELLHEEAGYVAGLGVRQEFQGKGLGELLLRYAIALNSELGRKKLCLNVDAGNESGALRLYEKVGMKPISEWHQYENVNWSQISLAR